MPTITFRGTHRDLKRLLKSVPGVLAGRVADPHAVAQALQLRLGTRLLSLMQTDFATKSRGGTGRDGVKWAPLAPATIANRDRKARKTGRRQRSSRFAGQYDVLRDTAKLFRSLTPGVEDRPSGAPDQVFRVGRGEVVVGTNVPYAKWHQYGTPKMPARPVLPVGGRLPPAYEQPLLETALRGAVRVIELLLANPGRLS